MSVINQMLRDLDQRQGQVKSPQPMAPMIQAPQNSWLKPTVAIVVVIVSLMLAYLLLNRSETSNTIPEQSNISSDNRYSDDPVIAESIVVEPPAEVPMQQSLVEAPAAEVQPATEQVPMVEDSELSEQNSAPEQQSEAVRVVKTQPNQTQREEAQAYVDSVMAENGRITNADYEEILRLDPAFHAMRIEWLTQLIQSDTERFQLEATSAIEQWPEVFQYRQILARQWVIDNPAAAYELLLTNMPTIEQAPNYHGLIAYSAQQMGEISLATKKYELLVETYPERADWWLSLALLQEQLNNSARALLAYQQSLRFPGLSNSTRNYAEQRIRAIQGY